MEFAYEKEGTDFLKKFIFVDLYGLFPKWRQVVVIVASKDLFISM